MDNANGSQVNGYLSDLVAEEIGNVELSELNTPNPIKQRGSLSTIASLENTNGYSMDIEKYLENVRLNCVVMQEVHKKQFLVLKSYLKYFKIPNIIVSSCDSVVSVGLQPYIEQSYISAATCLLSLTSAIITSIELYLGIENTMVNEESIARDYYILGINLFKMLSLHKENRKINGIDFLEQVSSNYNRLIEKSGLTKRKLIDKLMPLQNTYKLDLVSEEGDFNL